MDAIGAFNPVSEPSEFSGKGNADPDRLSWVVLSFHFVVEMRETGMKEWENV